MKKPVSVIYISVLYLILILSFLVIPIIGSKAVTTLANNAKLYPCVIIDAGHGGIDGGAVSCTGAYESHINLQIAQKLDAVLNLLGIQTRMIRCSDISVYTEGETIAAKKVSDLKERIRIINSTPKALCLSIHQNTYPDPKYLGAQVFYNAQEGSRELAQLLQNNIRSTLAPGNNRQCKQTSSIYLLRKINCSGVLIECGFLSNFQEEKLLRDPGFQKKLACVIAISTSQYLNT